MYTSVLERIDTAAFSLDILQSRLFGQLELDANSYANPFDSGVKRVLDIHAPLRTVRRRYDQHDSRHLLDELRSTTRQETASSDDLNVGTVEPAYSQTSRLISRLVQLHYRADHIKSEFEEAAGDIRATWRTAQ